MHRDTYIGLKVNKKLHIVSEEEVSEYLEKVRQANVRIETVSDRPAQDGDELIIDYAGFVGEEQFAGGTAEKQPLTLGSGTFIPGFEEQLVGAKVGDKVDVNVRFPEVYHAEALAGKEAVFRCTVHEIRVKTPYDLDDSFAQQVAGLDTLEEMREVLRKQMQASADEGVYNKMVDELLYALAQACGDMEVGADEVEREIDHIIESMEHQLAQQGFSVDQYIQFTGRSMEELREAQRDQAMFGARVSRALDEICQNEQIQAKEEDLEREYENLSRECGIEIEQVRGFFDEETLKTLKSEICQKKAVAFLMENAEITVVEG